MRFIKYCILILFINVGFSSFAQQEEMIYKPYIRTVQLFQYGNQYELPIYTLNTTDQLQLGFDDTDGSVKNYYYTYVLCDINWQPVDLNPLDYIKGFSQNRISTYRYSSISLTRYTHYQVLLPDRNTAIPTRSGNYLLKVFLDGDTSKLVFTKRMYVLDQKAIIAAQVKQPLSAQVFGTHQKIIFSASIKDINSFSAAQQVKAVILQNNRWDNALTNIAPTFVRGNTLEYNSENIGIFPAGKEWRWLDIRSFSLQTDRVVKASYNKTSTDILLKTDADRRPQQYIYFSDLNGLYSISTFESINPLWQGDYAFVYFSFAPPNGQPYEREDIYLIGALTGYSYTDKWKMIFNEEKNIYEIKAFIKQGYYNYGYVLKDKEITGKMTSLEGDYFETENNYTILLYYKSFTDRSEQLIGISQLNSRKDRASIGF